MSCLVGETGAACPGSCYYKSRTCALAGLAQTPDVVLAEEVITGMAWGGVLEVVGLEVDIEAWVEVTPVGKALSMGAVGGMEQANVQ